MRKTILLSVLLLFSIVSAHAGFSALVLDTGNHASPNAGCDFVAQALELGGYEVTTVHNPDFAHSFPVLDAFVDTAGVDDELLIYIRGDFTTAYSSLFLIPPGYDKDTSSLPLGAYNIQRLLNRTSDREYAVVLILNMRAHPRLNPSGQIAVPPLHLKDGQQAVLYAVSDDEGLPYKDFMSVAVADYLGSDIVSGWEWLLKWIKDEVRESSGGALDPAILGYIDYYNDLRILLAPEATAPYGSSPAEQEYKLFTPGIADPIPDTDGGGSYSF